MLKLFVKSLLCLSLLIIVENSLQSLQINLIGRSWDEYYEQTLNMTEARQTLQIAQQYFEEEGKAPGFAVDLGAGTGRDTLYLLEKGWSVLAIDAESLSVEILLSRIQPEQLARLDVKISLFSDMILPDNVDLVNASYSLPFCSPKEFPECWENIADHLAIGGRFAGQFFGPKDSWSNDSSMTFLTKEEVLQYFEGLFVIEHFKEKEWDGPSGSGDKHWHLFEIVAKKI